MNRKKWRWSGCLAALFLAFILVAPAFAVEFSNGDNVNISGTNIKGPLFVTGNNLTVSADVDGDVFCAGQYITINGIVSGDIIAASNTVQINGPVLGDVRAAGNTIVIDGVVEGNVTGAGNTLTIGQSGRVKRDLLLFGNTIQVNGPVLGQVLGASSQYSLNSAIDGDVRIWNVQNLNIGPNAVIKGQTTYNSAKQAQVAAGAQIGTITRLEPTVQPAQPAHPFPAATRNGINLMAALWSLAAGLVVWGVALWLVPRLMPRLGQTAHEALWPSLGWGFLTLLLVPLGILVLMITVIGIPLAMIFTLSYIIALILSKVIVSDALARAATRSFKGGARASLFIAFLIILAAIVLLSKVPVAGFFVSLVVSCLALGIIVLTIYRLRPGHSAAVPAEQYAPIAPIVPPTPPPPAPPAE